MTNSRQPRHQAPKRTKQAMRMSAFQIVQMGVLDRLNAASIAKSSGMAVGDVERMIAERRGREV